MALTPDHWTQRIPELTDAVSPMAVVRIPERRNIPLTDRVQAVVDHPCFQRLRRVRQLGPTHLVYPGATHVRFEHSLGVYGYTREFVRSLLATPAFADAMSEGDILTVLAAGLLHDLGHYPFAHSLEALHRKGRDTPRHEELGAELLLGEYPDIQGGARPIGDILRWEWRVDPERVVRLMTWKREALENATDRVLQSLISGAVDADKMDYLERDSIHMGVPFGRNYDRDRLLSALTLNGAEDGLAIWAKGKISAEIFIFCRYTMFSEAYWHHTVRSASAMVEAVLEDHVGRHGTDGLANELLIRNDDDLLEHLRSRAPRGSIAGRLLAGMTGNTRNLHKRIATYSRVYEEVDKRSAYQRLHDADGAEHAMISERVRARLETLVGHALHPSSLLIDTPPRDKDQLETLTVRYPDAAGRDEYPLHLLSQTISGTQKDILQVVKKIRVFCDPVTAAELRGQELRVQDALLEEILA